MVQDREIRDEKLPDFRQVHVFGRGHDNTRVDVFLVWLSPQVGHGCLHAVIAHPDRVLEDQAGELTFFHGLDELLGCIKPGVDDLSGQTLVLERPQAAKRGRFVRDENRVHFVKTGQKIFRRLIGRLRGDPAILIVRKDRDPGEFRADRLEKSFLALPVALHALDDPEEDQVPPAPHERADSLGGEHAPLPVVGGDIGNVMVSAQGAVENDRRYAEFLGLDHWRDKRAVIHRRQVDSVDPGSDHRLDDLDLFVPVVFLERAFPDDLNTEFISGRLRSGMYGLPELMSSAHGNDGQPQLFLRIIGSNLSLLARCEQASPSDNKEGRRDENQAANYRKLP
jgi:hypothetical protein